MQLFSSNFKLGILGGGQLGKMLLYDAKRYDLHTKVMDSNNQAPCAKIADEFILGDITNYQDVINFGNKVDIITVEIEKINTEALLDLEKKGKKVYPSAKTLQIIQNKSDQKDFYKKNNLPTSGFKNYSNLDELKGNFKKDNFQFPFVWKSSKFGYDGKGVKIINISRGPLVCETSVLKLLDEKFIDSVGFDVFETEPIQKDHPLKKYHKNIFGTHNGSNEIDGVYKTSMIAISKIVEFLNL